MNRDDIFPRNPAGLVWDETIGDQVFYALLSCCNHKPAVPVVRGQTDIQKRAQLPGKVKYTKAIKGRRIG